MSDEQNSYSAEDFRNALAEGTLRQKPTLVGFAKSSDTDGCLAFSRGFSCERWVDIPLALIENVRHLGSRPCGDHEHPAVEIVLAPSGDASITALVALAEAGPSELAALHDPPCQEWQNGQYRCMHGRIHRCVPRGGGGYEWWDQRIPCGGDAWLDDPEPFEETVAPERPDFGPYQDLLDDGAGFASERACPRGYRRCPNGICYDPSRACCCRRYVGNRLVYSVKLHKRPHCNCNQTCLGVNQC